MSDHETGLSNDERNIIIHAKNSILVHKQRTWQKKGDTTFDVTMGTYDGAETCELVGSFLLSQLQKLDVNIGLYRDDGLAISNVTPRHTENIKKEICRVFNQNGLRITIEANKQIINFLDVTFNLNSSTYQPFTKPNTTLQYIHRESNHQHQFKFPHFAASTHAKLLEYMPYFFCIRQHRVQFLSVGTPD